MPYDSTLPSKSFKKVQNYEKPKEKMQGNSEYQSRYTGQYMGLKVIGAGDAQK